MVAILEKINVLTVSQLEVLCDCKLFNYGEMRDSCSNFSHTFNAGKVYGVIGEFGTGGWALSYVLSGNVTRYEGKIF